MMFILLSFVLSLIFIFSGQAFFGMMTYNLVNAKEVPDFRQENISTLNIPILIKI